MVTKDRTDFSNIFSKSTVKCNSAENHNDINNATQPEIDLNKVSTPEAINYTISAINTLPEASRKNDNCNLIISEELNSSICKFLNIYIDAIFLIKCRNK